LRLAEPAPSLDEVNFFNERLAKPVQPVQGWWQSRPDLTTKIDSRARPITPKSRTLKRPLALPTTSITSPVKHGA
jgi:hypothetical protein